MKTDTLNLELGKEGLEIDGVEVYDTIANPNIEFDLSKVTDSFKSVSEYIVFFSPSGFSSSIELIQKIPVDLDHIKVIFNFIFPYLSMIYQHTMLQLLFKVAALKNQFNLVLK